MSSQPLVSSVSPQQGARLPHHLKVTRRLPAKPQGYVLRSPLCWRLTRVSRWRTGFGAIKQLDRTVDVVLRAKNRDSGICLSHPKLYEAVQSCPNSSHFHDSCPRLDRLTGYWDTLCTGCCCLRSLVWKEIQRRPFIYRVLLNQVLSCGQGCHGCWGHLWERREKSSGKLVVNSKSSCCTLT